MRVLDKRNFVNRLASQSQHVCIFKIQIFHVYKTLRSSAFSETQIGLPLFFSLENQNSANTIRNTSFIPLLYFLSQSILLHVCLLLYSLNLHGLSIFCSYFCFVYGLCSSSHLPGNNSLFLFC